MLFKHLKMTGFKSFAEPAEISIDDGLTGVVGPNGCGKSNIVESLRWLMGESSAKSMRGSDLEDIVFSGTASRPSRNFAEVTLTLDNADMSAPAIYNNAPEIEITRKLERGKGSSFRINGKSVRSRVVQLLFADMATGSRSSGIVSQGKIDSLINAKPRERRNLLEEAANISGLHQRRHEAELRLNTAENNLNGLKISSSSLMIRRHHCKNRPDRRRGTGPLLIVFARLMHICCWQRSPPPCHSLRRPKASCVKSKGRSPPQRKQQVQPCASVKSRD